VGKATPNFSTADMSAITYKVKMMIKTKRFTPKMWKQVRGTIFPKYNTPSYIGLGVTLRNNTTSLNHDLTKKKYRGYM